MPDTSHIQHIKPVMHTILIGVSYMNAFIASAVSLLAGFGLGWYFKGRGMAGVKIDINNIKNDIVSLKNKVDPVAQAPAVKTDPAV